MKQTMVLVGSGEFTGAMLGIDKRILDRRDKPLVAIVPLAAKQEVDYWKWVDNGVKHFAKLGIEAYGAETAGGLKRNNAGAFLGGGRAMGVVPYTIWPHFDSMLKEFREKWNEAMDRAPEDVKTRWLGIDEDTAVIFEPGKKPRVLGKGKAHWGRI